MEKGWKIGRTQNRGEEKRGEEKGEGGKILDLDAKYS